MSTSPRMTEEGGDLPLIGATVTRCCFDYGTSLLLARGDDHHELRLQAPFSIVMSRNRHDVEPEDHSTVGVTLELFEVEVAEARCTREGALFLAFTTGATLTAPPDADYEAWTLSGPDGFLVVALPGGGLAIWNPQDEQ